MSSIVGQTCIVGDTLCPASQKLKGWLTYVQKPLQVRVVSSSNNNINKKSADQLLLESQSVSNDVDAAVETDFNNNTTSSSSSSSPSFQTFLSHVGPRVPAITAAGCGTIDITEQVLSVRGLFPRYVAQVGDVVVTKVVEIAGSCWKCDLSGPQNANLMLHSVTDPGGVQRRRGREDELTMRNLFSEGDLIISEVQRVSAEGRVDLQIRTATKYGKCLGDGICVSVRPHLVRREGKQFVAFPFGISAVIGVNGRIWICITTQATLTAMNASWGTSVANANDANAAAENNNNDHDEIENNNNNNNNIRFKIHQDTARARLDVARMRCCLLLMSSLGCRIDANCMQAAFSATLERGIQVSNILDHDSPAKLIVEHAVAQARLRAEKEARFEEV